MLFDHMMMAADRVSPWQTYTGAQDGSPVPVMTSVYATYGGTTYYTSFAACMVSDTKGIALGFWAGGGPDGARISPAQVSLFTVTGTTVTANMSKQIGGEYYAGNGTRPVLVRLDDTHALMIWTYDGNGYGAKARVLTIDPVANTISVGAEIANPGTAYVNQAILLAPNKVFSPGSIGPYPVLYSISAATVSAAYPMGAISAWGIRGRAWRIDDTHLWCNTMKDGSTLTTQVYSISGTTASLITETPVPGGSALGWPLSDTTILHARPDGSFFTTAINPATYAISNGPTLAYTGGLYAPDDNCGPIDGIQLWHGLSGGAWRVCCASYNGANLVVSAPVTAYAGTPTGAGIRAFPNSPTKALAFYQVATTGYVRVLQAA